MENKQNAIPTDRGLQRFSTGINTKYDTPIFDTFPLMEAEERDSKTGIAVPSQAAIEQARQWVNKHGL
jgi:hypothetical protein